MIDHCSAEWGLDENISFYRHMYDPSEGQYKSTDLKLPTVNVTIQNTISAKALDTYNHAFGSTLGGENCMFTRNLLGEQHRPQPVNRLERRVQLRQQRRLQLGSPFI